MADSANAIVVKVKDGIHMFLFDDNGSLLDLPSIPITDDDNIYKDLKETQLQFVHVRWQKINPEDEINFENYEDFKKLKYNLRDLFSYTIYREGTDDEEVPILEVMEQNKIEDIVKHLYKGDVE